jgi:hypothetical protein
VKGPVSLRTGIKASGNRSEDRDAVTNSGDDLELPPYGLDPVAHADDARPGEGCFARQGSPVVANPELDSVARWT